MTKIWTAFKPYIWCIIMCACAALSTLAFAFITHAVVAGETAGFDRSVLLFVRPVNFQTVHNGLTAAAIDLSSLGDVTVATLVTAAVFGYLVLSNNSGYAMALLFSVPGGAVLMLALKEIIQRQRPTVIPHLMPAPASESYPSGHSMLAAIVYLTLGVLLANTQPRIGLRLYVFCVFLLMTFLIGVSRIYLGVHHPTDVVAGWCAGLAWACMCNAIASIPRKAKSSQDKDRREADTSRTRPPITTTME